LGSASPNTPTSPYQDSMSNGKNKKKLCIRDMKYNCTKMKRIERKEKKGKTESLSWRKDVRNTIYPILGRLEVISSSVRLTIRMMRRWSVRMSRWSGTKGRKESEQRNGRDEHSHGCYVIMLWLISTTYIDYTYSCGWILWMNKKV